jgi:hypothetical protein
VIDLDVPRAREGGSAGAGVLGRYKRRTQEIDDTIVSAYVHGASTRDIGQITETLMGEHVGRSTVSRVTKSLNQKVEELRPAVVGHEARSAGRAGPGLLAVAQRRAFTTLANGHFNSKRFRLPDAKGRRRQ